MLKLANKTVLITALLIFGRPFTLTEVLAAASAPVSIPKIAKIIGQPITLTWDDGRQATIEMNTPIKGLVPMPMELVENSCDSERQVTCEYRAGVSAAGVRLAWNKHPDSAKVGTTVKFVVGESGEIPPNALLSPAYWLPVNHLLNPDAFPKTPFDEISCSSWNWLGGGSRLPISINIPAISTELMITNPNTGVDENRTILTANDVEWSRMTHANSADQFLQLKSIASYNAVFSIGVDALFIGDVVKWTIEKSTNLYCDVGFKVDPRALQPEFDKILQRAVVDTAYTPYVYHGALPGAGSQLESILETSPKDLETVVFE